jgi:hypothetical protein
VSDKAKVLVICDAGGTYMPVGVTLEGRRSRSLVAIYKLITSKQFGDVRHVKGGTREWCAGWRAQGGHVNLADIHTPRRGENDLPLEGTSPDAWRAKSGLMPR